MPTIREQMLKARDLIQAKRYNEARVILEKIDHPKAKEWLAKIRQIQKSQPTKSGSGSKGASKLVKSTRSGAKSTSGQTTDTWSE